MVLVGVTQKSGIAYDLAKPRLAEQTLVNVALGLLVPKYVLPPIDAAAFTTFSPWLMAT
jgi:hypothetical protein